MFKIEGPCNCNFSFFKAPSMVPIFKIKKTWQSHIELSWDEIPLGQRNGIIQSYKVFYWNEKGPVNSRWQTLFMIFYNIFCMGETVVVKAISCGRQTAGLVVCFMRFLAMLKC